MRPALRYMGGKWRIAPWVASFFPPHDIYVEPFGGSAAVLLRKRPAFREVYNDINGDVVNFFRVLRDQPDELTRRLKLTPFSREEHDLAWLNEPSADAVERARRLFVRSWMSVGPAGATRKSKPGFRRGSRELKVDEVTPFVYAVDGLPELAKRLRTVTIENNDAFDLLEHYDGQQTLFYIDPPYCADYSAKYVHEFSEHERLLNACNELSGYVLLSGYDSSLYRSILRGWRIKLRQTKAFKNKDATECLWISPRTWDALQRERGGLLAV